MTSISVNHTTLANGITLPHAEVGNPEGTTVLFLHAFGDSWRSFETVLQHFPSYLHGYALTQRGHGDADRPWGSYRPEDMAMDVVDFMDRNQIPQAVLVGHSSGSMVAQIVASQQPDRVLGLALIGAPATFADKPGVAALWQAVSALEDPVERDFIEKAHGSNLIQPVPMEFMEVMTVESLKVPARVLKETLRGILDTDPSATLNQIAAPTLLVWGDHDVITPRADQDIIIRGVSGSRLLAYEDAGHMVHWEYPDRIAKDIATFIDGLSESRR